ncbi:sortase domain-containing protein [Eubacterium sp.]|uniref:sortase domain-containing protein n=1 Tax=Eubacterium sp. TaxID=142586 RepID=UPI003EFF56AB
MSRLREQNVNKQKKHRRHNSDSVVYPYLYRSISFVLISMFIFAPLMILGLDMAKSTVNDAKTYLTIGYNDINTDNSYNDKTGNDFINSISLGSLIGTVSCERIGLNENIYYGYNRVSLRDGAGLDSKSYLFGMGGCSRLAGYSSSSFGSLYNIEKGDVIEVKTPFGNYSYKVYDAYASDTLEDTEGDALILGTAKSSKAFSAQSDKGFYVYASLIDKEVD